MKRRKHRLYIDATFSHALNHREAAKALAVLLDSRLDLDKTPIYHTNHALYANKLVIVEKRK